jgi:alkylation response protein AidB-like acyl-CoA dehydrogenase
VLPFDTWQRCCPLSGGLGPLVGIGAYLAAQETRAELASCESAERYPEQVIAALRDLGAPLLFAAAPDRPYTTSYHISTLNAVAAQHSGSLAVTLGITGLALLPVYIAGTSEQLDLVRRRMLDGAQAAMLLSEWSHGSDLLATDTRAERGRLEPGGFVPSAAGEPVDRYRLRGEKQLTTLARTSPRPTAGIGGAGGLTLLLVERDASVEPLPRFRTLPAPAADIGGARFHDTLVPAGNRIGEEGEGFRLVQSALCLSRGGISAFASGTASRACGLAMAHAAERVLYGQPIARLLAVADHLARMAAFDLACTCLSVKAAAAANALGQRAAHLTAVAKLVCCDLAERAVSEGRAVVSARALLADLPYQQVVRDVILYGIFDGTRHVMLDQIQWRVRQMCRQADTDDERGTDVYRAPPVSMIESSRRRGRPWLPRPARSAARLASLGGAFDLDPLCEGLAALEAATACLPPEAWDEQPLAFALADSWARVEAALAVAELGDPVRRRNLGMPALPDGPSGAGIDPADLARLSVAMVALTALTDARTALAGCGIELGAAAAERGLALEQARAARAVREAIRDRAERAPDRV